MVEKLGIKYHIQIYRFFEMSLGAMTWAFLTSPIWLGLIYPQAIVYLLTFLAIYWSYLAAKHSIGLIIGYRSYTHEKNVDWFVACKKLDFAALPDKATLPPSLAAVRHFILIPAVAEPYELLKESIDALVAQTFPLNQIVLIYTLEQNSSETTLHNIKKALGDREQLFYKVLYFIHPFGILGEAVGVAGANRSWGAKHAVDQLRAEREPIRNYIFSTIDSDHVLNPQYISRLTHLYLSCDKRDNKYYSTAVHQFNNNLWRVPIVMRIEANAVTLGTLSDWVVAKRSTKDTFTSYSASLQTLIDANYWDVKLGVDDTIFYWRAFIARNGDFEGVPHFIPYNADAVEGRNYINSYVSLYKQLLRWGWGAIDFPLSMSEFVSNSKIPLMRKLEWMLKHLEKRVLLINMVFLITFGFNILTLVNPYVKQTNFAYALPNIMSMILTATLVFLIPGTIIRLKLATPIPREWPIWMKILAYLEGPLIVLNMLTFSFFPFIEAQTRMLLGRPMKDLYHTPKMRKVV